MRNIKNQFLALLICTVAFSAEDIAPEKFNGFNITSIEKQIRYNNPGYELKQIVNDGISYTKLEMNDAGSISEPGQPYLPTVSTFYAVEPGKAFSVQFTIEQTQTYENVDILPFNNWDNDPAGHGVEGEIYSQDALFPENIAAVSEPIIFRDIAMVQVSITPFQYNPVTKILTVIEDLEIELIENGIAEMPFVPEKRSRAFESLYESLIINYSSLN